MGGEAEAVLRRGQPVLALFRILWFVVLDVNHQLAAIGAVIAALKSNATPKNQALLTQEFVPVLAGSRTPRLSIPASNQFRYPNESGHSTGGDAKGG